MEYGGFEGIIPKGQYGGGTVMLWDQGSWEPQPAYPDVDAGLRDGSLKFILHGTKLKGKWALVRMKDRPGSRWGNSSKPNWLLIKEHDPLRAHRQRPRITEESPNSVVTGRSIEQIARQRRTMSGTPKDTANPTAKAWRRNDNPKASPKSPGVPHPWHHHQGWDPIHSTPPHLPSPPTSPNSPKNPSHPSSRPNLPRKPPPHPPPPAGSMS